MAVVVVVLSIPVIRPHLVAQVVVVLVEDHPPERTGLMAWVVAPAVIIIIVALIRLAAMA